MLFIYWGDTLHVLILCLTRTCIKLYTCIPVSVTLIVFQGHGSIKNMKRKTVFFANSYH